MPLESDRTRQSPAPSIPEDDDAQRAKLLRVILWGVFAISLVALPVHLVARKPDLPIPLEVWPNLIMCFLAPLLIRALGRGYVRPVAFILLGFAFVAFASIHVIQADPMSPRTGVFLLITLSAGVLLEERGAIAFGAGGLAVVAGTVILTSTGVLVPSMAPPSAANMVFVHTVLLGVSTFLVVVATRSRWKAMAKARQYAGELEERSHELQATLDAFPDLLLHVSADGTVRDCKAGAEPAVQWMPEVLLGRRLQDVLPKAARERIDDALVRLFQSRQVQALEYTAPSPHGPRAYEARLAPFREAQAIVMVRDITSRWEAQEEARRLTSELERRVAERTAALEATNRELEKRSAALERSNADLEQFAYVASHDLQEPLRMVSSYAQLLSRRYQGKLDGAADEFIGFIVDGAQRMSALIRALLDYSRVGRSAELKPTESQESLVAAVENLHVAVQEAGAEVTYDALPRVEADAVLLTQLFQNLVGNALKFRRKDVPPRVHVAAVRAGAAEALPGSADAPREAWVFSVKDNGIGIPPEYTGRLFTLFQRLHARDEYPGTGIGLATCKKIVERQGGRIWVESKPGEGATFFFSLPVPPA